ncbi:MAG: hypothetical protein ABIN91_19735 [Mucilaginibacter sp.]|uniref:hypothetical protein n=1 Tax=Mucilaginibacter sp. TaxID=1882438 RepID=UPI003263F173
MDKHLHIHILDVLQQNNAIGNMVDIKPAFTDELNTQEGRKNFKTQLDYLVTENLIETSGKFEFLTWELLTGLYPIDNKKIEARLTGNWQSYLAKRGGGKPDPAKILPVPPPAPEVKLGLYDAPATVLPYPGVNIDKPKSPALPKPSALKADEDDFEPFKVKNPKAHPDAAIFLKEEDFLPFKTRNANKAKVVDAGIPQGEPILISTNPNPASKPEPLKAPAEEPFFTAQAPYTPPAPEPEKKPDIQPFSGSQTTYTVPKTDEPKPAGTQPDFSIGKTTYSPPKSEAQKDIAVTVKPFTPATNAANAEKPARIPATVKRKAADDEEAPIITARTSKRPAAEQQYLADLTDLERQQQPVKQTPAVVNLRSSVAAYQDPAPARQDAPSQNEVYNQPPSSSNYAAIRFDTENNPFNVLGKINLDTEDEKSKPNPLAWKNILKWAIIGFIALVVAVIVIYKIR